MKKIKNILISIAIIVFILSPIARADMQDFEADGGTGNGKYATGSQITDSLVAGNLVANFIKQYISEHGDECVYDIGHCENGYYQIKTSSPVKLNYIKDVNGNWTVVNEPYEDKYPFECTNFAAFAYKETFGIIPYNTLFVTLGNNPNPKYFEIIHTTDYLPGDILRYNGHVAIALNESYMMEARSVTSTPEVGQSIIRSGVVEVLRLKISEDNPLTLQKPTDGTMEETKPPSDVTIEGGVNQYIDPYDPSVTIPDPDSFEFPGLAKENFIGMGDRIEDLKKELEAIVDFLKNALTWILGIMLYPIKMVFIGWIQIMQGAVSSMLSAVTGTKIDNINLEDIIFNKIQLLDVNVFTNTPGGTAVVNGGVVSIIREGVRTWYYTFRNVAIADMLITLLYLGIRMALNTVPEGKAKYKQMLIGWIFGFAIVFFIHYFILIVITLNESLLQIVTPNTEAGTTVFQEIEAGMYQIDFVQSFLYIFVFIVLFIYTLKFFYVYLKRYLTVMILIMMAPLMGIVYSIDRINGNKTSGHFTVWIQEFTVNVLIQFVHGIIYVVFVSSIFSIIQQTKNIVAIVIIFILLRFMMQAETLVKKMFKLNKAKYTLKDIAESTKGLQTIVKGVFAGKVAKEIGSIYVSGAKKVGSWATKSWNNVRNAGFDSNTPLDNRENSNNSTEDTTLEETTLTDIDEQIKEEKEKQEKNSATLKKEIGNYVKNSTLGGAQVVLGLPMMVFSPATGISAFANGVAKLKQAYGSGTKVHTLKRDIKGPTTRKGKQKYRFAKGLINTNFYRGIAPNALTEAYKEYKNTPNKVQYMEEAKNTEIHLVMEIEKLKEKELIVTLPKTNKLGVVTNNPVKDAKPEQIEASKEFNKALNTLIKGTSKENTQKAVSNYFAVKTVKKIKLKNVEEIAQGLEHIKVSEEFGANFKTTLKLEMMNSALSSNDLSDDKTRIHIDKTIKNNIKEVAKQAKLHYKETKEPYIPKPIQKQQENEKIYEALDNAIDDNMMEKTLEKMSAEDLTRVIHKTVLQQDSIQKIKTKPEFEPILENVQKLQETNEEARYNTGEAIYDMESLVKEIKTKLTKKDVFER